MKRSLTLEWLRNYERYRLIKVRSLQRAAELYKSINWE